MTALAVATDNVDGRHQDDAKATYSEFARCIVPLLDALGWRGDRTRLAEALPHFPQQTELIELINTMANLKYEGREVLGRMTDIDPRQMPCLFIPEDGGTQVLIGALGNDLLVYDGREGIYTQVPARPVMGRVVFFTVMRGNASSFLLPQAEWFRKVLERFRSIFLQAFVLSLILSGLAMLSPLMVTLIYDNVLSSRSMETLLWVGTGMALFVLADAGFRMLRSYLFQYVSVRLGNLVGNEVLRRLLYLPPSLTETTNLGAQVSRVRDFENIREFFAGAAVTILFDLPFIILLLLALIVIGGSLAYVPLVGIALFVIFVLATRPVIQRTNAAAAQTGSERQSFIIEMLSSLRAIKLASAARLWTQRHRTLSAEAAVAGYEVASVNALVNAFSNGLVVASAVATMAVGVQKVFTGEMTPGTLMAAMALVWRILTPLGTGLSVFTQVGRILRSVEQVDRLMNMRLESRDETLAGASSHMRGNVLFSNVSIRYAPDAPPALVGISFTTNTNEMTAIIGHDGAGKSTVLKLALGLYTPQAGRILIDNINLRQFDPVQLRRQIAYMPKNTHFFFGTIAQNIRLANPAADVREIEEACRLAGVLDQIMALP
ncbi:MAG: ATP-binding cassette domain-containing protein, partial [Alphaproteobacteria bacterium]|nr:ATP-binding cassette domain-containing protein [Alphaproteobacteria bacterium]